MVNTYYSHFVYSYANSTISGPSLWGIYHILWSVSGVLQSGLSWVAVYCVRSRGSFWAGLIWVVYQDMLGLSCILIFAACNFLEYIVLCSKISMEIDLLCVVLYTIELTEIREYFKVEQIWNYLFVDLFNFIYAVDISWILIEYIIAVLHFIWCIYSISNIKFDDNPNLKSIYWIC